MPAVSTTIRSKPAAFSSCDGVGEHRGRREVLAPRRERAHEELLVRERVHADAVAEQRAARAPARRVHGDDGDAAVREETHDAIQDLVGERGLAGAAGAGDADDGRPVQRLGRVRRAGAPRRLLVAQLEQRDRAREVDRVVGADAPLPSNAGRGDRAHAPEHVLDHAVEAELQAVVRRVDLLDAVGLEFLDLVRRDRAAAADHHADVRRALGLQHVHHVAEVLVVPALVAADGDAVGVFLDRRAHDVGDAAVVAEVHDFGAVGLQDAADDVDRGIVAVEQRGRAHEAQRPAGGGCRLVDPFGRAAHRNSPARRSRQFNVAIRVPRCCHAAAIRIRRREWRFVETGGDVCSTREAADRLGVSLRTVQLWSEAGLLRAWKTPGGHRRILTASVDGAAAAA